eukprot:TRINITY_DN44275_c0_g1_i1.p1 TRINITY_DN44275_c0_g1~~TRINITY_DN44275_c0_g1_i1.p1  ORF type:complete len:855 (+),score=144.91 TRINITY_DN44275_c0_g1_i1:44-2608(+)
MTYSWTRAQLKETWYRRGFGVESAQNSTSDVATNLLNLAPCLTERSTFGAAVNSPWSQSVSVCRRSGCRPPRNYTVHVAGSRSAVGHGEKDSVDRYTTSNCESVNGDSTMPPAASRSLLGIDHRLRPLSRVHMWPVLDAGGVEMHKDKGESIFYGGPPPDSSSATSAIPLWRKMPKARMCVLDGASATTSQGLVATPGCPAEVLKNNERYRVVPFRAGCVRPRLFERKFQPETTLAGAAKKGDTLEVDATPRSTSPVGSTPPKGIIESQRVPQKASPSGTPYSAKPSSSLNKSVTSNMFLAKAAQSERQDRDSVSKPPFAFVDVTVRRAAREHIKSALKSLKFSHNKKQRLREIRRQRRIKSSGAKSLNRDHVVRSDALDRAKDAFDRHFAPQCKFGLGPMMEALGDFGINPSTRLQKQVVYRTLERFTPCQHVSLDDFITAISEVRFVMRSNMESVLSVMCDVDKEGLQSFDHNQLIELLERLNLMPTSMEDIEVVEVMIEELRSDAAGRFDYQEAKVLIQQMQEFCHCRVRQDERKLQEQHKIDEVTFLEFRSQLVDITDAFSRLDEDGEGLLDFDRVLNLLAELGCIEHDTAGTKDQREKLVEAWLEQFSQGVSLSRFLSVVQMLRSEACQEMFPTVRAMFMQCERSGVCEVGASSVCRILGRLGVAPKTVEQQAEIARIMNEHDTDGTGRVDLEELLHIVQLIREALLRVQRRVDFQKAEELRFSRQQVHMLRRAFDLLDESGVGVLSASEVVTAVQLIGWRVTQAKLSQLFQEVDDDSSGSLDFREFLTLMRRVDDDIGNDGASTREATQVAEKGTADEASDAQSDGDAETDSAMQAHEAVDSDESDYD